MTWRASTAAGRRHRLNHGAGRRRFTAYRSRPHGPASGRRAETELSSLGIPVAFGPMAVGRARDALASTEASSGLRPFYLAAFGYRRVCDSPAGASGIDSTGRLRLGPRWCTEACYDIGAGQGSSDPGRGLLRWATITISTTTYRAADGKTVVDEDFALRRLERPARYIPSTTTLACCRWLMLSSRYRSTTVSSASASAGGRLLLPCWPTVELQSSLEAAQGESDQTRSTACNAEASTSPRPDPPGKLARVQALPGTSTSTSIVTPGSTVRSPWRRPCCAPLRAMTAAGRRRCRKPVGRALGTGVIGASAGGSTRASRPSSTGRSASWSSGTRTINSPIPLAGGVTD